MKKQIDQIESASIRPPAVPEIEAKVLGAILLERESIYKAAELLSPEMFYLKEHRLIYASALELYSNGDPIDTVTLYESLKKKGQIEQVGGAAYLSKLTQNLSSAANVDYHCKIVLEKYIKRNLISSAMEIAKISYEDSEDTGDILDKATSLIFNTSQQFYKHNSYDSLEKINREMVEFLEKIKSGNNKYLVKTDFYDLDELIGGFKNGEFIIIAARPSMGKSACMLNLAENIAKRNIPVGIISLEMSKIQLNARLIAQKSGIAVNKLLTGEFQETDYHSIAQALGKNNLPLFIDACYNISILELVSKAKRLKAEQNIRALFIDYLQQINSPGESREREISNISKSLKALAMELDIPVIVLSQLNREVEKRTDKRPMLSDLRDSGSLEQDADIVIFIYRPEYYGTLTDKDGNSLENIALLLIEKQRNAPTGECKLVFRKEIIKFENRSLYDVKPITNYNYEEPI